jgi:membrane protein implicated in regulation of membrane protease activity
MSGSSADVAVQEDRAPLVVRWLFRTLVTAPIAFVVFGLFTGFGDGLWWEVLVFAALSSAATPAADEWRERRARRRRPD